jgi:hypothetical protein
VGKCECFLFGISARALALIMLNKLLKFIKCMKKFFTNEYYSTKMSALSIPCLKFLQKTERGVSSQDEIFCLLFSKKSERKNIIILKYSEVTVVLV